MFSRIIIMVSFNLKLSFPNNADLGGLSIQSNVHSDLSIPNNMHLN